MTNRSSYPNNRRFIFVGPNIPIRDQVPQREGNIDYTYSPYAGNGYSHQNTHYVLLVLLTPNLIRRYLETQVQDGQTTDEHL